MNKNFFVLAGFILATLFVASCNKDDIEEAGTSGTARVKILQATRQSLFFAPFTDTRNVDLFSVRRDETSPAGIDKSINIVLEAIPDSVDAYNNDNGTSYEVLPDSLYTLADNGATKSGNTITIPLGPKVIGNELTILMDGSKWDVTHKYGMYYKITDPAGLKPTTGSDYIFVTIEAKNQWDGVYEVTGSYTDLTNPAFKGVYPYTWELQTLSPNQCVVVDNTLLGGVGFVFDVGDGSLSYYGSFGLIVTFDPVTNEIVSVENYYGQPSANTRSAFLDPSGENGYDPTTKTIAIKYYMTQPSVVVDPPHVRAKWDEVWKYTGPRE